MLGKYRLNEIYNEDCLLGLKGLPSDSIDLVVTSPPYNIKDFHSNDIKYDNYEGNDLPEEGYQDWIVEVLNELHRVLKPNGSVMFNHKVRISDGLMIHPLEFLYKTDFKIKQEIVWWQNKGANVDKSRFFPFSERVYWLTKRNETKMYNVDNVQDVIRYVPRHSRKDTQHPAVMPYEVAEILTKPFGDNLVVLDPFVGSGTTFVVAKDLGHKFIGFEISEKYTNLSKERVKNHVKQHSLDL